MVLRGNAIAQPCHVVWWLSSLF